MATCDQLTLLPFKWLMYLMLQNVEINVLSSRQCTALL